MTIGGKENDKYSRYSRKVNKDPDLQYTQSGIAKTKFTLAVNRTFKNANGEQEADYINVVVWRKPAENAANYLKKGSLAGVSGRIETRNFEGQDGKRVYVTEVVAESVQFLDSKQKSEDKPEEPVRKQAPIEDTFEIDPNELPF